MHAIHLLIIKDKVVKQLLLFIHLPILIVVVVVVVVIVSVVVCSASLSLAAEVMCISVFPGFWVNSPMIHVQELLMTFTVAYIGYLAM